jgi:hypothetical protein
VKRLVLIASKLVVSFLCRMLEIWILNEQDIFLPVLSQDREKA